MFIKVNESCLVGDSGLFQEFRRTHGLNNVNEIVRFFDSFFGIKVFKNGFIFYDFDQIVLKGDIDVVTLSKIF